MVWGLNTRRGKRFFKTVQTGSGAQPASYSMGTGFFHEAKVTHGVILTTHFHLALTLGMSGAIPLLPLSAFMAWTGTSSYNGAVPV